MNRLGRWLSLALVVLLVGCSSAPPPRRDGGGSPRVRCLSDPRRDADEGSRPLFFLFCVESP
jgi:hypothetical protein